MSLIDELRAAAEEYATEATITQEAWSAALVEHLNPQQAGYFETRKRRVVA